MWNGARDRYGPTWDLEPERIKRVERELGVIETAGFSSYFIILASIMDFCRHEHIPYGPGRGSVGGCYVGYLAGIHEMDSLEWDLLFERFLTPDRVSYPDVDLDFSQVHRHRVIDFVRDTYQKDGYVVLQVAAFSRAGGRSVIDHVLAAMRETDPTADSTAIALRNCLPEGNITGGTKQPRELAFWLDQGHGDKDTFRQVAESSGWMGHLLKIDGMFTNLARHAAGVVILSPDDLKNMPRCAVKNTDTGEDIVMTGFDMYDLDELKILKYDMLGLRTVDVISDAHKFTGGSGDTRDWLDIWREHRNDKEPYQMLCDGNTLGIFQMETAGYRHTLKQFLPEKFDHIVQLNALYRPGALDYTDEDTGQNMVELFIERRHHPAGARAPTEALTDLLRETHGIFLYQEQAMKATQILAGFTDSQADELRKGIGKKRAEVIEGLKGAFIVGARLNGHEDAVINRVWENIEAAARYSWNKSHAVEYGALTWCTLWFKYNHPAAFFAALFNSYGDDKPRLSHALSEARQTVKIEPPNINVTQEGFVVRDGAVVFGLNGIKGMGEKNRTEILQERSIPFGGFQDFCQRLPSVPMNMKLALIRCGAFDETDARYLLLAKALKPGKGKKCEECDGAGCDECSGEGAIPQYWTVADHINHNHKLKNPRPLPPLPQLDPPTDAELSKGEVDSIGFYISDEPLAEIAKALNRVPNTNHWGGEIDKIYKKKDRRGQPYATAMVLTPSLQKIRVLVFASVWENYDEWLHEGQQVMIRGKLDGETVLANAFFEPDDVRHFKKVKLSRDGEDPQTDKFDGKIETVRDLESAGYQVKLL